MAAITKIEFWSDVGFIDGAVEIPRLNAPDPTNPTVTIEEEILPSKDRFFSELKLKEYYTGLLTMSYMRVTYDLKNSLPKVTADFHVLHSSMCQLIIVIGSSPSEESFTESTHP